MYSANQCIMARRLGITKTKVWNLPCVKVDEILQTKGFKQ
jgi:hypothetical protein